MNAFPPEKNADFAGPGLINLSWPGLMLGKAFPISPAGLMAGEKGFPGLFFSPIRFPPGKRTHIY